jgi:hypothetical protein
MFTLRSLIIGTFFSIVIGVGVPAANTLAKNYAVSADYLTPTAIFLFFILTAVINTSLRKFKRTAALTSAELILIYSMMLIASAIPSWLGVQSLLTILTGVNYHASPANDWLKNFVAHIPAWMIPQGQEAITGYYEGLPGGHIPWKAWRTPLAVWLPFFLALYLVMISIAVILRKQWVEKEKISYPLVYLPLQMASSGAANPTSDFFKNKLMWMGFAIPFLIGVINGLHNHFNIIPAVQLQTVISLFRHTTHLRLLLLFPVLGLAYLVTLDVCFSIWFFHILFRIISGYCNITGFGLQETNFPYAGYCPLTNHLGMGALITLAWFILWNARVHLKQVFKKAFLKDKTVDDSEEIISYRAAVWILIFSFLFVACWLRMSGLPWIATILVLVTAFILFLCLTRIVAQAGLPFARAPYTPQSFTVTGFGSNFLDPRGTAALGLTYSWSGDLRTLVMTSAAHSLKMQESVNRRKKYLFWGMLIACIVTLLSATWSTLSISYLHGAINTARAWPMWGAGRVPGDFASQLVKYPMTPSLGGWLATGAGALIMGGLMFLRTRFLAFPLHFLGFPIADTHSIYFTWFNFFLIWIIKSFILRYGGIKLYRKLIPFFLGMVLGSVIIVFIWEIIDYFLVMPDGVQGLLLS